MRISITMFTVESCMKLWFMRVIKRTGNRPRVSKYVWTMVIKNVLILWESDSWIADKEKSRTYVKLSKRARSARRWENLFLVFLFLHERTGWMIYREKSQCQELFWNALYKGTVYENIEVPIPAIVVLNINAGVVWSNVSLWLGLSTLSKFQVVVEIKWQ